MLEGIAREDIPSVYDLSASEDGSGILIKTHRRSLELAESWLTHPRNYKVADIKQKLGLAEFVFSRTGRWGYGETLEQIGEDNIWQAWRCLLPRGGGILELDWQKLYPISATFKMLFLSLGNVKEKSDTNSFQLLHIADIAAEGGASLSGGALNAFVSRRLMGWIAQQPLNGQRAYNESAKEKMQRTYLHLRGIKKDDFPLSSFSCHINPPHWLHLRVPGNASGLTPDSDRWRKGEGCELLPNNMDTELASLPTLVGLADLYSQARKAGC